MRALHLTGLILWRGGLLLAGGTALVLGMRFFLRFFDIPDALEIGLALLVSGFVLVILSLVIERVKDLAEEKERA